MYRRKNFSGKKRKSKKEFERELAAYTAELAQFVTANSSGLDPTCRADRIANAEQDFSFFAQTYFSHYLTVAPSKVHLWLFEKLPKLCFCEDGARIAVAAPRGEAKSTIVSLIFVLWCVIYSKKKYIVLAMDAFEQAAVALECIKAELEFNACLKADFPDATGRGKVWKEAVILTRFGQKIEVFGSGKRLRGRRHGPYRPDLAILDDIENDENVRSPAQRDKLAAWVDKAVAQLGGIAPIDIIFIGTILHYDSVLSRKLKAPLWASKRFQALARLPDRMDLWDRWSEILQNPPQDHDGPSSAELARSFFNAHQVEMEDGAELSWPEGRPLYKLMQARMENPSAFDSELQNDPVGTENATFGTLHYWAERQDNWVLFGALDPSLGKAGGDPSAILVGGWDREARRLHVIRAEIRRRVPDRIISDVIALQKEYNCLTWFVETVQFQEFLRTELIARAAEKGINLPARGIGQNEAKELRIESIQPMIVDGRIKLHASQATLIEQLRHFPKADHDDGPDALEILWRGVVSNAVLSGTGERSGQRGGLSGSVTGGMFTRLGARLKGLSGYGI